MKKQFFCVNLGKFCRFFHELKFKKLQGGTLGHPLTSSDFYEPVFFTQSLQRRGRVSGYVRVRTSKDYAYTYIHTYVYTYIYTLSQDEHQVRGKSVSEFKSV